VGNYRFRLLDHLLTVPNDLTLPALKLDPIWDPCAPIRLSKKCPKKSSRESSVREGLGNNWRQLEQNRMELGLRISHQREWPNNLDR
jgi:hypothetical protein